MAKFSRIKKDFLEAMRGAGQTKTQAYDTPATVLRTDGDTLWVHIPGGVDETPIKKTIDAKRGDVIQVRVGGGTAWATGNQTAPPTDDTKAKEADTKAKDANILAKLAKKTADKAGKTATNYLSWSAEYGLIVSEDATENPEDMQGGSTRVTFEGVDVYRGQTRLAHFGDEVILGDEDGANAYLGPDTFRITSSYGVQFFSVDMDGEQRQLVIVSYFSQTWDSEILPILQVVPEELDRISNGTAITLNIGTTVGGGSFRPVFNVVKGTEYSGDYALVSDIYLHLDYDGENTYEFSLSESLEVGHFGVEFRTEPISVASPSYTIGTRASGSKGAFSVAIGEGLVAEHENQIALGKYNEGDPDNLLEIGHGTASTPRTIFAVSDDGNVKAENLPAMMECGAITNVSNVASHSYADYQVTFTKTFSSAPIVVVGMMSSSTGYGVGSVSVSAHSITTTGFTARIFNNDTSARSPYIHWIAMKQ